VREVEAGAACASERADYKGKTNHKSKSKSFKFWPASFSGMIHHTDQRTPLHHRPPRAPFAPGCSRVAALIALMVLVGGATRLTESGMSIVRVETGYRRAAAAGASAMEQAFEAYKTIPQYRAQNAGMSLSEFRPSSGGNGATGCSAA